MKRLRYACCLVVALAVPGCAGGGGGEFSLPSALGVGGHPSDLALAELAKGDFAAAERHALAAIGDEPGNPYALLAAALVYENSGRPQLARRYYETLAALQPAAMSTLGDAPLPPRPVGDIALTGYRRLTPSPAIGVAASPSPAVEPPAVPDDPMAARFDILARLLSAHLIADAEYRERRAANLGGLLPYTAPPPPPRLRRPPPSADQFVQRLQALARNFEMRAVGAGEYAAERGAVLDGLLPATPAVGGAPPPPRDELALAAAVGRLERLKAAGLITAEERAGERRALEAAWAPAPPVAATPLPSPAAASSALAAGRPPAGQPSASATAAPRKLTPASTAGADGASVHLASLKSEKQAWDEWRALQARFPLLQGLTASVARVDLGRGKGVVYRLKAGPLDDGAAADRLCQALRDKRQYCAPTN